MRKTGLVLLCGLLLCGAAARDPARALANDPVAAAQAAQSTRDQQAAAQYLQIWSKAYGDTTPADAVSPDQPPLDVVAMAHGSPALREASQACAAQAAQLKTMAALLDCTNAAIKTLATAEKLRDARLLDSFIVAVAQLGADTDAGKLSRRDAARVYGILGTIFDRAALVEFKTWLARKAPAPAGDAPPYDLTALAAAATAGRQANDACLTAAGEKGAATLACLMDSYAKFTAAAKIQDTALTGITAPLLRQAAAEVDAGTMQHAELLGLYQYLQTAVLLVMDDRYGDWLGRNYSRQFDKRYADAQTAHGKYVANKPANDETAATAARDALNAAYALCNAPDAFKTSTELVACRLGATKNFVTAEKLRDTDLFDAYADTARSVAADADAGKMSPAQRESALGIVADAYDGKFQREDTDYRARADKPLIDAYVARFDKSYADAIAAHPLKSDTPAYDAAAVEAADSAQTAATAQCEAKRPELKTGLAVEHCYMVARRNYYAAINGRDKTLLESFAAAQEAAAADADSGKITQVQAGAIFAAVGDDENNKLLKQQEDYQARTYKPVIDAYVARFDAAYAAASAAHPLKSDVLPYDPFAIPAAEAALKTETSACTAKRTQFKNILASENCFLDAYRVYYPAIKAQDENLISSFIAALESVAKDADAGKIAEPLATAIFTAIGDDETKQLIKLQSDYQARSNKPLVDAYVARFDKAYADAVAGHLLKADAPPYDPSALARAEAEQTNAADLCKMRSADLKTQRAREDCYLDIARVYGLAIKQQDAALLDSYIAAQEEAASDADSGKITLAQLNAILAAISQDKANKLNNEQRNYEAQATKPITDAYSARLDKFYADDRGHGALMATFIDVSVFPQAAAARNQALAQCSALRTASGPVGPWMECALAADKALAASVRMADLSLLNAYAAASRSAALDTDAGTITRSQFASAYTAILTNYNRRWSAEAAQSELAVAKPKVDVYVHLLDAAYVRGKHAPAAGTPFYDKAAMPGAMLALNQALAACAPPPGPAPLPAIQFQQCGAPAYRQFAAAIKLQDMTLLEAFTAATRRMAEDVDTGKLTRAEASAVNLALRRELLAHLLETDTPQPNAARK